MLHWLRHVVVVCVLTLSVYIGLGNSDDITSTITVWQHLVGVMATTYALLALVALVGYGLRTPWLSAVLWV